MADTSTDWIIRPDVHTVDRAVDLFLNQLPLEQAKELAQVEEWELPDLHHGLGMEVRRMFKMWNNCQRQIFFPLASIKIPRLLLNCRRSGAPGSPIGESGLSAGPQP